MTIPRKMLRFTLYRAANETIALLVNIRYNLTSYMYTVDMVYHVMSLKTNICRVYI